MKQVLFGEIEFTEIRKGKDTYPLAIIHGIYEQCHWADDSHLLDQYRDEQGHDGYLIPSEFKGEIVYSKHFMQRLGALL